MDTSGSAAIKFILPKVPFLLKTALLHTLRISSTSSKWNLRTELVVKLIRHMVWDLPPLPILKEQRGTLKNPPIKGPMWVSKVTVPAPEEDDLRQLLFSAINELNEGGGTYHPAPPQPVEAEWTGYRSNVAKDEPEPSILEEEKFAHLMEETTSPTTILLFHGGAYYMLDPAYYRPISSRLAKMTGGRIFSVRYRLAPQNPFPAALLDALNAYLALLYPPKGSPHQPVPASTIVFAGDSAGGNLVVVLLRAILQFHRMAPAGKPATVFYNGREVELPLPAGVAVNSPWLDQTSAFPSQLANAEWDYLIPNWHSRATTVPPDAVWPADPPRTTMYCEGSVLRHPLVSPVLADLGGSPPLFAVFGDEMLGDEMLFAARRWARQGVVVVAEQYEAMPHCFPLVLEGLPESRDAFQRYARFCRDVVERPETIETRATRVAVKSLERTEMQLEKLVPLTDEQVDESMRKYQAMMIEMRAKPAKAML